jgi:hypothetical protein
VLLRSCVDDTEIAEVGIEDALYPRQHFRDRGDVLPGFAHGSDRDPEFLGA